jgi:hypothetical protein
LLLWALSCIEAVRGMIIHHSRCLHEETDRRADKLEPAPAIPAHGVNPSVLAGMVDRLVTILDRLAS